MSLTVCVIPGTGRMGSGFCWRLAKAGHKVLLGSRDAARAEEAKKKILEEFPNADIQAGKSEDLPYSKADVIIWTAQTSIAGNLELLKNYKFDNKIVLDITNICYKQKDQDKIGTTSSTEIVNYRDRWVSGFKTFSFMSFKVDNPDPAEIFSDDEEALQKVKQLFESTGIKVTTGPLEGARGAESKLWTFVQSMIKDDPSRMAHLDPYFAKE